MYCGERKVVLEEILVWLGVFKVGSFYVFWKCKSEYGFFCYFRKNVSLFFLGKERIEKILKNGEIIESIIDLIRYFVVEEI